MRSPIRVAVTGAAGNIGYALVYRIANGDLFGPDQPVILQLIEVPVEKAMAALKGVAMELDDCAFPLLQDMVLTSDPKVRHNFAEVSKDGKKIYYASNKRNRTYFDVYSMDLATGKEDMLYQYDGNVNIAAVNDAGTQFVLSRAGIEKSLDNDLFLVDVRTKKEVHLTPHTDASEFGNVAFLGDSILMTSNDKREYEGLVQIR